MVDGERGMNGSGSEIGSSFKARNLSRDDIQYPSSYDENLYEPQTSRSAVAAAAAARRQIPRYGTSAPGP